MAGESNYGGNGSVHWETILRSPGSSANFFSGPQKIEGRDPSPIPVLGPDGDGCFRVRLRFNTSPTGVAGVAAASVSGAGSGQVDAAMLATRRLQIETELLNVIASAQKALATIQGGAADAQVDVKVPAVNRGQRPAAGWEVTVEW